MKSTRPVAVAVLLLLLLFTAPWAGALDDGFSGGVGVGVGAGAGTPTPSPAEPVPTPRVDVPVPEAPSAMTAFEQKLVEQAFRLLPERHPFVLAYERTYGVDIDSYTAVIRGVRVSGIPFDFGGSGKFTGFSESWWLPTGVSQYPVRGLDCAEYIHWVYRQAGYTVPSASTTLFFSGKAGMWREDLPGVRAHMVIPSLSQAMIGDIAYNSKDHSYRSGHGSHTLMYLGTADKLGITAELQTMFHGFPGDAHLLIDCGWADGDYYYQVMKKLHIRGRRGMCGVGIQFFTTIKDTEGTIYQSPSKKYKWKDPESGYTFTVERPLERNKRYLQAKRSWDV